MDSHSDYSSNFEGEGHHRHAFRNLVQTNTQDYQLLIADQVNIKIYLPLRLKQNIM